jgi:alpha-beta hydrolase superfamily lysophospholipase
MIWLVLPIALVGVLAIGAVVIAWFSMHPPRYRIRETPASFGAAFEDVRFTSADGTRLVGWWAPAPNPRAVLILCHGMSAHRGQLLPWAEWFWKAGYSLLLFDFRALGESGGDLCTMGLQEPDDVLAAVDYVKSRPDGRDLPLGALGFSMGGVAVMLAAARDERIEAISTLGSYTGLDRAIAQRCRRHFGPLGPVVERPARKLGARWFPGDPLAVDCLAAVKKVAPRPCLFVNGMKDPIVPPINAEDLYAASAEPKELLLLPHTPHDYPHPKDQSVYEEKVLTFFNQRLAQR